ncbi:hypothetical protein RRG08_026013 [Elysia crispata]|uniref:Uncharacterized protein n=1 Tax=Elysia crispata TaxID=231223 RepID=A0AAE0Y5T0_9GAST|nr:hypothetical protein RRG08_026013 [Elysia crispata]
MNSRNNRPKGELPCGTDCTEPLTPTYDTGPSTSWPVFRMQCDVGSQFCQSGAPLIPHRTAFRRASRSVYRIEMGKGDFLDLVKMAVVNHMDSHRTARPLVCVCVYVASVTVEGGGCTVSDINQHYQCALRPRRQFGLDQNSSV